MNLTTFPQTTHAIERIELAYLSDELSIDLPHCDDTVLVLTGEGIVEIWTDGGSQLGLRFQINTDGTITVLNSLLS